MVVALLVGPALVDADYDSYPLSAYPMFSHDRQRVTAVHTVVGVTGERRVTLDPDLIAGSREPMLAAEAVGDAILAGRAGALCAEAAARVAARGPAVDHLEVATERYDTIAYLRAAGDADGRREPLDRQVWATCRVP